MASSSPQNDLAQTLKALHKPGDPLILTNIWDAISARTIASLPGTKALGTASYAIAAAAGIPDEELTLEINLHAIRAISTVAREFHLPLTVDLQDGFGSQLDDAVRSVIALGAVGINLEDFAREKNGLYSIAEATGRIERVLGVARELGVPEFVVNARTDALFAGPGGLNEAIERGKAYLDAGAANVFIWGGPARGGWSGEEVKRAVGELGGRLNVLLVRMKGGGLSVGELKRMGVARISVGPQLMMRTRGSVGEEAERILRGECVE